MATLVVHQHQSPLRQSPTPPPLTSALHLNTTRSTTPIPNKHIPYCSPGPVPAASQTITPPNSPPSKSASPQLPSLLYPPTPYTKLLNSPPIYGIDSSTLASALAQLAAQSLPDAQHVFPWLHGLHPENTIQLAFFVARKKSLRRLPRCLRSITIIKAGGDLTTARLKGAVAPDEILSLSDSNERGFLDCDPKEGFSVRNFAIQTAKLAQVSDIVIYGDDTTDQRIIKSVAERTAIVQRKWRRHLEASGQSGETYNTFVLTDSFETVERDHPELVGIDSSGTPTSQAMDFLQWERAEMCEMSKASEFSSGVYQGPSPMGTDNNDFDFDVFIETSDHAVMPDDDFLASKLDELGDSPIYLSFPSSGSILPPSWSQSEVDGLITMCRWIYAVTHPRSVLLDQKRQKNKQLTDSDGDIQMHDLSSSSSSSSLSPRKVLIHCADGYTESSLLTVAYFMYAEALPVHTAWLRLHTDRGRNFFAYPSDVALLTSIQDRLISESPSNPIIPSSISPTPAWLAKLDGSLPSRILPYMYLGNLTHANNPQLLRKMGIKRILSIGEPVGWTKSEHETWNRDDMMMVDRVQDNGIDPLTGEFERCLEFIGRLSISSVYIHMRVRLNMS